jgi:HEAT repeat protein
MTFSTPSRWLVSACALALATFAPSQQGQGSEPAPAPTPAQTPAKLAEWPPLSETDKERLLALVGQFRKQDEKLREGAAKQLMAIGDPAMPLLMQQVSDRADNVNDQLFALFDKMLEPRHAALMARESKKPRVELRRYLVRRLCTFADREMLPVLEATAADKDPQTAFYAHLGALALGRLESLQPVLTYTKTHWKEEGGIVSTVLPPARCHELGAAVFESITKATPTDQMAGLRLVRYLAMKEQQMLLRRYLESPDHTVKREAVNAARVLNGETPIEDLSVFKAIEMSKDWLKKL